MSCETHKAVVILVSSKKEQTRQDLWRLWLTPINAHVDPTIGQPLSVFLEAVSFHSDPSHNLVWCPSVRVVYRQDSISTGDIYEHVFHYSPHCRLGLSIEILPRDSSVPETKPPSVSNLRTDSCLDWIRSISSPICFQS